MEQLPDTHHGDRSAIAPGYEQVLGGIVDLLNQARSAAARSVNTIMTATYWSIGRRIVDQEQGGQQRADYRDALIDRLSEDLTARFGRGFSPTNLRQFRRFYLTWPTDQIQQTASAESNPPGLVRSDAASDTGIPDLPLLSQALPLPWSAYVRLMSIDNPHARRFYETEALRSGWTVRQLTRQINSMFYERTALSRDKAAMLRRGEDATLEDVVTPEEAIKDPFVLEFLGLKDEYSETDLEDALISHLADFLLELGDDFAFIGRQRRMRIGDSWYRVDLVFYHRGLRCLLLVDLKIGAFSYAAAGQMHMYLNYAAEQWAKPGENPPVGLILCAEKDADEARYALDGLPNPVLAAEYRLALPTEATLEAELTRTRQHLEQHAHTAPVDLTK